MKLTISRFYIILAMVLCLSACRRDPLLHLHRDCRLNMNLSITGLDIDAFWDYEAAHDWDREWVYGWDSEDYGLFGPIGYTEMNEFQLRRYFLGDDPTSPHTNVRKEYLVGKTYRGSFDFGYYDMLVWNEIQSSEFSQAIIIKESLDSVVAQTSQTKVNVASYPGTKATRAYNQPETLFSGYLKGLEVTGNPDDYTWNEKEKCYEKSIQHALQPLTYIYLVQFVLHNNAGRISLIQGDSNLSAMASGVCMNSGITLKDAITVNYMTRLKNNVKIEQTGEIVDVIGGKVTTFGLCGMNPTKVTTKAELEKEPTRHYIDLNVTFLNGLDSTFVFDVTDKVREMYKGGIITIDIDVDKVPIPVRPGGSGFEAVVKDPNKEDYEIII